MTASTAPEGAAWSEAAISLSWNQVVSDYKAFHDVRVRGGTVDDLPESLREPVVPDNSRPDAKLETVNVTVGETKQAAAAETTADSERAAAESSTATAPTAPAAEADAEPEPTFVSPSDTNQLPAPSLIPQAVLGNMDGNKNLKKLLMSWYYAGYYTGLYEGQQQGAQGRPEDDHHAENEAQP